MALIAACILAGIFIVNVLLGALSGSPFLSDVWEMLILFAAAIAFTATILRREARAKKIKHEQTQGRTT